MSQEALSMAKLLVGCVTRGDVNGQYHWANLIMLDALANGAKKPEIGTPEEMQRWFDPSNWGDTKIIQPTENGG